MEQLSGHEETDHTVHLGRSEQVTGQVVGAKEDLDFTSLIVIALLIKQVTE